MGYLILRIDIHVNSKRKVNQLRHFISRFIELVSRENNYLV